ncbi:MAG TPA: hypothetical protein VG713_10950 [Pirellulales bacterium]|nr:hypothetical protein [Pirellulales bacterium]
MTERDRSTVLTAEQQQLWSRLVSAEPLLLALRSEAKRCDSTDWASYERLKREMKGLVGHGARSSDPELRTSQAYETAHRAIFGQTF